MMMKRRFDLTLLKILVYFMAIVLACSMLFITYTIYIKSYHSINNIECNLGQLNIDKKIISSSISGNKILLLTEEKNNQQKLMVFDSCSWKLLSEANFNIQNNNETIQYKYNKELDEDNHQILS